MNVNETVWMGYRLWSAEPIYHCPNCGGGMHEYKCAVFLTDPPKKLYQCANCDNREYRTVKEIERLKDENNRTVGIGT